MRAISLDSRPEIGFRMLLGSICGIALAPHLAAHESTAHAALTNLPTASVSEAVEQVLTPIEFIDAESGSPIAGNLRIRNLDSGEYWVPAEAVPRPNGWLSIIPGTQLTLPRARLELQAFSGLAFAFSNLSLAASNVTGEAIRFHLEPLYGLQRNRWWSGNTHLHLALTEKGPRITDRASADRYLQTVPQADGLEMVFLSYLARFPDDVNYISNEYTDTDLLELSKYGALFANGQEHRHNFGAYDPGYGHALLLDIPGLIEPVSMGPGIMGSGTDDRPLRTSLDIALGLGSTTIWCHNEWGLEDIPSWIDGRLHAQNIFDTGHEGSYSDSFYRYLDVGIRVPFSTGTDWFIRDLLRVNVPAGEHLETDAWLERLRAGKSHISNGPFLDLSADGASPGATLDRAAGDAVRVHASAIGRADFRGIELILDGEVVSTSASRLQGNSYHAALTVDLTVDKPGWLAVRIPLENEVNAFDQPLRAHSSAVYINVNGKRPFDIEVAQSLIDEMSADLATIVNKGVFASQAGKSNVRSVYLEAITTMQERIKTNESVQRKVAR